MDHLILCCKPGFHDTVKGLNFGDKKGLHMNSVIF